MIWIIYNTEEGDKITIRYDSKYAEGMINQGWHPKSNHQILKTTRAIKEFAEEGREIHWEYVKGHIGDKGNERANRNAKNEQQV